MKKSTIVTISAIAIAILIVLGVLLKIQGSKNTDNRLRKAVAAQEKVVETSLDKMRKTLINQYKVNQEFAENFIKAAATLAEGRKGGDMFKMVTEAGGAPQGFTPELAMKMMNSTAGEMAEFKRAQDTWVDKFRAHDTFYDEYIFLGLTTNGNLCGRDRLEAPNVISSGVTKEAMATGVMDDDILPDK